MKVDKPVYRFEIIRTMLMKTKEIRYAVLAITGRKKAEKYSLEQRFSNVPLAEKFCDKIEKECPLPCSLDTLVNYLETLTQTVEP